MINRNFISIIGGAGHVGLHLGLALSSKGNDVILIDNNQKNIKNPITHTWINGASNYNDMIFI